MEEKETKNTEIDEAPATVSETEPATTVTVKPQKTLEEQIGILKSRKLYIEDETDAMSLRHYSRNMIASLNRYAWVCRINGNSYYLKNKELRISANVDILFSHLH